MRLCSHMLALPHSVHWYRIRLCSHTALSPQSRHFERYIACRYLFLRTRDSSTRSIDGRADTTGPSRPSPRPRGPASRAPGADPEGAEPGAGAAAPRQGGSSHSKTARACLQTLPQPARSRATRQLADAAMTPMHGWLVYPVVRALIQLAADEKALGGPTPWGEGGVARASASSLEVALVSTCVALHVLRFATQGRIPTVMLMSFWPERQFLQFLHLLGVRHVEACLRLIAPSQRRSREETPDYHERCGFPSRPPRAVR